MTIAQVIDKADLLRPNALPYPVKADWVLELNGQFAEMMGVDLRDAQGADGEVEELLMDYPHKNVYVLYLCAMIDWGQEETDLYADDLAQANQAISEARAWYRRNHRPARGIYHRDVWLGGGRYR